MSVEKSLGVVATILAIIVSLNQLGVFGDQRIPGLPGADVAQAASLSISRGSGPSGTIVTLRGSGFEPGETVQLRFHTDEIATAHVGRHGGFRGVHARIPGSFDVFAPMQFEIVASGTSSAKSAEVPFELTQ
jgi:hypothetical protein